jgi:hypothetical protein
MIDLILSIFLVVGDGIPKLKPKPRLPLCEKVISQPGAPGETVKCLDKIKGTKRRRIIYVSRPLYFPG